MRETARIIEVTRELPVSMKSLSVLVIILSCGILAYTANLFDAAFEPLFMALVLGIIAGNIAFDEGRRKIAEKYVPILLPIGIILYGINIKMPYMGSFKLGIILATLFASLLLFISVIWISSILKLKRTISLLLACGSSVCGVSAIAIISPLVKPSKEEFSAAIMTITAVGLTGAIVYPVLAHHLNINPENYAVLTGATLHQTGLVKISAQLYGVEELALAVKGIRIALIALVTLAVSIAYSDSRFYVPWYIVGFLGAALFSSHLPIEVVHLLSPFATIMFASTLAAIGYTVELRKVQKIGLRPLLSAYAGWALASAAILGLIGSGVL